MNKEARHGAFSSKRRGCFFNNYKHKLKMEIEIIKADQFGLQKKQVDGVDVAFASTSKKIEMLLSTYISLIKKDITPEVAAEARTFRLGAVKLKSEVAATHQKQKEFSLAYGRYCDALKNKDTLVLQTWIDDSLKIEKFEEDKKKKMLQDLQTLRVDLLSAYDQEAYKKDYSSLEEDDFKAILDSKKRQHEAIVLAKQEAEAAFAKIREEEEVEKERIIAENERLRKDSENREKIAKIENEAREEVERAEAKEREELEAGLRAKAVYEREQREKVEAELKEIQDAKQKELAEKYEKAQEDLSKNDDQKMESFIDDLEELKGKYTFESDKSKNNHVWSCDSIDEIVKRIRQSQEL